MKWNIIFWKAWIVYFHWAAIAVTYFIAKRYVSVTSIEKDSRATTREKLFTYICCVLIVLGISALAGSELGTHREGGDVDDPGDVVIDFEPTDEQRWTYGAKVFLVLLPASLLGLHAGYEKDKRLTPEERLKLRRQVERDSASSDDW
jgi:hypothetical protein